MNFIERIVRNIKARAIVRETDRIARDYPELSYQQAFCKALEVYGMEWTEVYRKWNKE